MTVKNQPRTTAVQAMSKITSGKGGGQDKHYIHLHIPLPTGDFNVSAGIVESAAKVGLLTGMKYFSFAVVSGCSQRSGLNSRASGPHISLELCMIEGHTFNVTPSGKNVSPMVKPPLGATRGKPTGHPGQRSSDTEGRAFGGGATDWRWGRTCADPL